MSAIDWKSARRPRWLWDKTGGHCAYCGRAFASPQEMTTDHVIPKSKGGPTNRENKLPACRTCNGLKFDRPLSYLREMLRMRQHGRPRFTSEQMDYLRRHGFVFPDEPEFVFYWERLGNSFSGGDQ